MRGQDRLNEFLSQDARASDVGGSGLADTVDFFSEIAMPSDSTAELRRAGGNSLVRVRIWTAEQNARVVEFFEGR